jgi:hypothetical protein
VFLADQSPLIPDYGQQHFKVAQDRAGLVFINDLGRENMLLRRGKIAHSYLSFCASASPYAFRS